MTMTGNRWRKKWITALLLLSLTCSGYYVIAEENDTDQETDITIQENSVAGEVSAEQETAAKRPTYRALDYVALGTYKGIQIEEPEILITDAVVEEEISSRLLQAGYTETKTSGKVKKGDRVILDYTGQQGEAYPVGASGTNLRLIVGSGSMVDGFEEALVGKKLGEAFSFSLIYPEHYFDEDLAGQEVIFTVTVKSLERAKDLTDKKAAALSDGSCTTAEEYTQMVKAELEASVEDQKKEKICRQLLTWVANQSTIKDYPQDLQDYLTGNLKTYYQSCADQYGLSLEDFLQGFLNLSTDEFDAYSIWIARESMQQELYLLAIAEQEGLEISEEEYQTACEAYAAQEGYADSEELQQEYSENEIRVSILQEKALEVLYENAVIIRAEEESEPETADSED